MSLTVELRPVVESDLDLFINRLLSVEERGPYQWFGYQSGSQWLRKAFAENGLLSATDGTLTILADNEAVGRVEWFKDSWGGSESAFCWTIGIGIKSSMRNMGIGTLAQMSIVEYLFAHTRVARIQAFTDVENIAERRSLEKSGFQLEGILRSAQWRNGSWHDQALYSVIRPT